MRKNIKLAIALTLALAALLLAQQANDTRSQVEFTESNLPIIIIDTNGQDIVDDPRIVATMRVLDNGPAGNKMTDTNFVYDGRIAIELRGSSSLHYPKKSYRLETQDENGENLNVELLGLPQENDWILNGPYADETLIRNALAYKLSREIGRYAPRSRFCELVINDVYRGLYVLLEKIKRDKNRINIARLDADDLAGDSLTGGYIIKIDKDAGENNAGWKSESGIYYQYDYPKPLDIKPQQEAYIQSFMNDFESAMAADWSTDHSFLAMLDLDAAVDHFLLNELCKNVDAFRISAFMYKDRDDKDGRLVMGPIWDMNLSMGEAWFKDDKGLFEGWQVDYRQHRPGDFFQPPFWWEKLAHDPIFVSRAQQRWHLLRQTTFSQDSIFADIDAFAGEIGEAATRNFELWPEMLENNTTYELELEKLKQWLINRLAWIDDNLGGLDSVSWTKSISISGYSLAQNYPNPFNGSTTISFALPKAGRVRLIVYNLLAQPVATLVDGDMTGGAHVVSWHPGDNASGPYYFVLSANDFMLTRRMLLLR